jgi:hypothetical protein
MATRGKEGDVCMRDYHLHMASARRDDGLARIRKLTLWIGGGAAAASLGLGTAFAHAIPGHAATSHAARSTGATTGAGSASGSRQAGGQSAAPSASPSAAKHRHHQTLTQPQQQPAPAQAPPVVTSGGS